MKVTIRKTFFTLITITINIFFAIPPTESTSEKMAERRMHMSGMFGGGKKGSGGYSAMEAMLMAGVMAKLMSSSGGSGKPSGGHSKMIVPMPVIHMSAPVMGGYGMGGGGYGMPMGGGHEMSMGGGYGMPMGGGHGKGMGMTMGMGWMM